MPHRPSRRAFRDGPSTSSGQAADAPPQRPPQDEGLSWLYTFSFILRRPLRRREAPSRNGRLEGRPSRRTPASKDPDAAESVAPAAGRPRLAHAVPSPYLPRSRPCPRTGSRAPPRAIARRCASRRRGHGRAVAERCRSGRTGRSRKPLCALRTVGSNPTLSATLGISGNIRDNKIPVFRHFLSCAFPTVRSYSHLPWWANWRANGSADTEGLERWRS